MIRGFILPIFLVVGIPLMAQNNFFVYKYDGQPYVIENDSVKSITIGLNINKRSTLVINDNESILFINEAGEVFNLNEEGEYSYKQLSKIKPQENTSSFVKKMFQYLWKDFTNMAYERKNIAGVVYRGDGIALMKHPADSIKIYYSEIKFEWDSIKDKTKEYYFILKDLDTDKTIKIGTLATSVSLFVDSFILKDGGNYKWAITETKYPNYKKTVFYNFKILNKSEFEALEKEEIKEISKFLEKLGFSKNEIRKTICQDYKICY